LKFDHSHWIAISPLTLCELLFTLWLIIRPGRKCKQWTSNQLVELHGYKIFVSIWHPYPFVFSQKEGAMAPMPPPLNTSLATTIILITVCRDLTQQVEYGLYWGKEDWSRDVAMCLFTMVEYWVVLCRLQTFVVWWEASRIFWQRSWIRGWLSLAV